MIHIKSFNNFLNESQIPKFNVDIESLLSILGEKIDLFKVFKIDRDQITENDDIDKIYNNNDFNKRLKKNGLKKGKLEDTSYDETLLDKNTILKFFFLYKKESIELEEPEFIILQYIKNGKRSNITGYTNKDNINDFYEKLTDALIELTNGKDTYLYKTTNGGNNWEMKNVQMEDEEMKGDLDKEELQNLIKKLNLKIVK